MNQFTHDVQVSPIVQLAPSGAEQEVNAQRLVVVLRDAQPEALLASRILAQAEPRGISILLVGITPDPAGEAALRRQLVTIAAFLGDGSRSGNGARDAAAAIPTSIRMECGKDWISGVRLLLRPGDLLACYSEQNVGRLERPLSDILASSLGQPVYTFTGLQAHNRNEQSTFAQAASWIGSLASIGGFLLLQARIVTAVQGWMQGALLLLTLFAEVGIVWMVNSLFGQS